MRKDFSGVILLLVVSLFSLGLFELVINLTGIDINSLEDTLYYQYSHQEIHRVSYDSNRLFELIPGAKISSSLIHPKETKYSETNITINNLGFRDVERSSEKSQGVFRIVVFGGSNTFGATVSDEDTYTKQMQNLLDREYPGRFEIWNAGVHAYVLSQEIAYAEYVLENFNPDLILIQITNRGRRAFLYNSPVVPLFRNNPELYLENIPLLISNNPTLKKLHYFLLLKTGTYRYAMANINRAIIPSKSRGCNETTGGNCFSYPFDEEYAEYINARELSRFLKGKSNSEVIFFYLPEKECEPNLAYENILNISHDPIRICDNSKSQEYYDLHPPSYVYGWYAEKIIEALKERQVLP